MYRRLPDPRTRAVRFTFEGATLSAQDGDSVAAALLAAGIGHSRTTPKSGAARAPYCMMGVCFECLIEIDGIPNRQGCLVTVRDGMDVRRQLGAPGLPGDAVGEGSE
ncbi:(2Fe-2S)-binding protein [Nisaea sp.]|uniref:(2Fe-2S)-binding protein n=1 Tax=Nisaea sp. TaxID=2024842 RepID=UPI0032EDE7E5